LYKPQWGGGKLKDNRDPQMVGEALLHYRDAYPDESLSQVADRLETAYRMLAPAAKYEVPQIFKATANGNGAHSDTHSSTDN
jgi:hypothetical protein